MAIKLKNKPGGHRDDEGFKEGSSKSHHKHGKKNGDGNSSSSSFKSDIYCDHYKITTYMKNKLKSLREKNKVKHKKMVAMVTDEGKWFKLVIKVDTSLSLMVKLKETGPGSSSEEDATKELLTLNS